LGHLLDGQQPLQGPLRCFVGFFATFLFGSLYLLAAAAVQYVLSGPQSFSPLTTTGLLAGAYVGAFEMGIPFIFFGLALRLTSNPALINQLCYLAPFLSLFIISSILHEHISPPPTRPAPHRPRLLFNQYIVRTPQTRETPAPQAP
jgi:drug/metabolite transporter (DMT)-like permease